jgi:hypothetical protein
MNLAHVLLAASVTLATPAEKKTHSQVATKAEVAGDVIKFEFKVTVADGLHLNKDAPWALKLQPTADIEFKQNKLARTDLDEALPGFRVETTAKPKTAKGSLPYTLTAFVCTDDKKLCYRDVLQGEVAWQRP